MLGTSLTWERIFEQTDRDINLQRVMNIMSFGATTGEHDWIPDRAIGPTEDALYELEKDYNDGQLSSILHQPLPEVQAMNTEEKRTILMKHRSEELRQLIRIYYRERGWTDAGIPKVETLQQIGLWDFLTAEAKKTITGLNE
jgi:aldehyde:ferredoxin oxidoreductase